MSQNRASDMRDNDFSATVLKESQACWGYEFCGKTQAGVGACGDGCDNPFSRREATRDLACPSDTSPFVEPFPPFLRFVYLSLTSTSATVLASANTNVAARTSGFDGLTGFSASTAG